MARCRRGELCLLRCDYALLFCPNKAVCCVCLARRLQIAFEDPETERERAFCPKTEQPLHSQPTLKRHGSCLTASSSSGGPEPWILDIGGNVRKDCTVMSE